MSNSIRILLLAFIISFVVTSLLFVIDLSKPRLRVWLKIDRGLLNPYGLLFFGIICTGLFSGFSLLLNILLF